MEGQSISSVPPVSSVASSWSDRQVVTRVYSGDNGQVKVQQDIYNITVYDAMGNKQTVTTSHSIDYLV